MSNIDILRNKHGTNEPITIAEIREDFPQYSRSRVAQIVADLIKLKELIRCENGIYYIPVKNGNEISSINTEKIIEKKYIHDNNETYGFYTGSIFEKDLGITPHSSTIEIMTNNESTRVREVSVGGQVVKLKKSRIRISKDNFKELQFLEFINNIKTNIIPKIRQNIKDYIHKHNLSINKILGYLSKFPAKATKNLFLSKVISTNN